VFIQKNQARVKSFCSGTSPQERHSKAAGGVTQQERKRKKGAIAVKKNLGEKTAKPRLGTVVRATYKGEICGDKGRQKTGGRKGVKKNPINRGFQRFHRRRESVADKNRGNEPGKMRRIGG